MLSVIEHAVLMLKLDSNCVFVYAHNATSVLLLELPAHIIPPEYVCALVCFIMLVKANFLQRMHYRIFNPVMFVCL